MIHKTAGAYSSWIVCELLVITRSARSLFLRVYGRLTKWTLIRSTHLLAGLPNLDT